MARLVVELFGGLRVATNAGREIRIPARKAQALLVCLALKPGVTHARDQVAALLWDDTDAELARASLRQALGALRRALPPETIEVLVTDVQSIALDPTLVSSDVQQFRELVREGSPAALVDGAGHFGAELLPGFTAHSAAFDAWLDEHRRTLRRESSQALQRAAAHCRAAGDIAGAVEVLSRLVVLEPANEIAQRELMDAYARTGRYTDALRQYRACVDALRRDLDVAPDPATEALYREVLRRRRADPAGNRKGASEPESSQASSSENTVPEPASPATLRDVVVLVACVASARPGQANDPELLRERWSRAEERIRAVVNRLGGAADRLAQGEVVAVFGLVTPTGNELDRAARAAAQLVGPADPAEAGLAVGIARGLVLPAGGSNPFPIAGQPVTAAQELARTARTGTMRFAADLAAQVSETGPSTDFAGRRAELATLETLFDRVVATRRGRIVLVRGEPGIGKSALLEALAGTVRARADVFAAHVMDFGQPASERPGAALAAQLLGISSNAPADARLVVHRGALEDGRLEADDDATARDLLGIGVDPGSEPAARDDAARARSRTRLLGRLIARAAALRPLLLLVEDTHWADANEIAQLGDVAAAIGTLPVLLAMSTRAEGDPFTAAWRTRARGCPMTTIDLAPLADDEARELAATYADVAPEVLERCIETAAGHPLFLVQLLRSARAGQTALPGSVRALLLARAERLPPEGQRLLHAAATLGTRFPLEALRQVATVPVHNSNDVESLGLLLCDGEDCHFPHALIRAAVYESLLRSTRRTLHQRAAQWYAARDLGLFAEHLAAAEDPAAVAALLRAADTELRELRLDRALHHAERALALAAADDERCAAHDALGEILLARGCAEDSIAAYRQATLLAAGPGARAHARLGLAGALRILDRYDEALDVLDHAEHDAIDEGDARRLGRVWTLRGNLHFPRGEFDDCLRAHERALELAHETGSAEDTARALGGLGDAHYQRGRMRTALIHVLRCLELAEQHGFAALRLAYLPMSGATRVYCGELEAARAIAGEAAAAAHRAGDHRNELVACGVGASADLHMANYESARRTAERGRVLAREIGAGRFETEVMVMCGLAELRLAHSEEALAVLEDAAARALAGAATYCGPWALGALALAVPDPGRSRQLLEQAEGILANGAVSHNHLEFHMLAIERLLEFGDWQAVSRQVDALASYTRDEPLPWADVVMARAKALVAAAARPKRRGSVGQLREALEMAERLRFLSLVPRLRAALPAGS